MPTGEILAVVRQKVVPVSAGESASVHIDEHGPLAGSQFAGPDVDAQTILSSGLPVAAVEHTSVFIGMRLVVVGLVPIISGGADVAKVHATADTRPWLRRSGTLKPQRANGGRAVRNSLECVDAVHVVAAHLAGRGFDYRRPLRRGAWRWPGNRLLLRGGLERRHGGHCSQQGAPRRCSHTSSL